MELGLSLSDATPSKPSDGVITSTTAAAVTTTTTTVGVNKNRGFCMGLGINTSDGASCQQTSKTDAQDADDDDVDDDDGDEYDDDDDDDDDNGEEHHDEQILKDNGAVGSQRPSLMNPPVQLDLLPSEPVLRHHTYFPWSPDNGSSEGGSSGNAAAGMKRMPSATEEATSSFQLEFYGGRSGSGNHKRGGFEIGNDAVALERASSRASDEDDHHGLSRKKLRLSKEQSAYLEENFKEHNTLNPKQKVALAEQLHLRPRQVEVWFQNRRARTKLKQTEVDFEYLKRCCETLTDENRRLRKELQELRALKTTSNPFSMLLPATTLTMCPSCERVATTSAAVPLPSSTNPRSPKPRSLMFPVSHAQPSNNSHHQPHE